VHPARSRSAGEDDDGAAIQVFGNLLEVRQQGLGLMVWCSVTLPEQDQARKLSTLIGQQFTEVGVRGDQDPTRGAGCFQDVIVDASGKCATHDVHDIMAGLLE
jgi:hypothetical protein